MSKARQLLDDLRLKKLNKLWKKNKDEVYDIVDVCSTSVLEYYYNDIFNKSEREFRKDFYDLILFPIFLKSLKKLTKKDGSKYEGFAFVLSEAMETARHQMNDEIAKVKQSSITEKEKEDAVNNIKQCFDELAALVNEISDNVTGKTVKKLRKIGFHKEWAKILAPDLISDEFITEHNMFRYLRHIWKGMYRVQELGAEYTEDGKSYASKLGVGLEDYKVIEKIMKSTCMKNGTKDMYMELVIQTALDQKDRFYQNMTVAQKATYDAITMYILDVMNSSIFDRSDRIRIIKTVARKRVDSRKGGYDTERRVLFSKVKDMKDIDGNYMFPKVVKAWNNYSDNSER